MSQHRRTKISAGTSRQKLRLATGATHGTVGGRLLRWSHGGVPNRVLKAVFGLFLLLPAWVLTQTFFAAFSRATMEQAFWVSEEFWFFALGAVIWALAFVSGIWLAGKPWPLHVYVFGHEATHAIWVWLFGGRVLDKKLWSADGGYIVTDTHNFLIALAPYFYPLYSLVVIVLYGAAGLFYDVAHATGTFLSMTPLQWLFFLLGGTWSFHLSFTIWMIPKGQTDLTAHGSFFSLVVIYLMNLLLLALFLIVASPEISFASFGQELQHHTEDFSEIAWQALCAGWLKLSR